MPELPDLQVFARNLNKELHGKQVKRVHVENKRKLKVNEKVLRNRLEKQELTKVYREGKELYFAFGNGAVLAMHLMLHGKLYLYEGKHSQKYPIIDLQFADDTGLVLTDYQGAATPTLDPEEKTAPDALAKEAGLKYLKERLAATRAAVKNVLLDQKVLRGIGNAYADEILWEAGISPFSASNKIPADKVKALAKAIPKVLKQAEQHIRKTHPDLIAGEVRDFLTIHNAKKTHSPTGGAILHKVVNSRKTYYTEEQELYE